jgi:MoaA/NifB/PqqE/SkfB family radical SAM enzyme
MADVARSLSVPSVNIVPYYYFPNSVGAEYERELKEDFDCTAFSWKGFHHEVSGVEFARFREELKKYRASLGDIYDFPYMPLAEDEYRIWFQDSTTAVGSTKCMNVEKLIDVQPSGETNFCVDFPDYSLGNVKKATISEVWNGERARRFRDYRRERPLSVCYRCGARYISEIKE